MSKYTFGVGTLTIGDASFKIGGGEITSDHFARVPRRGVTLRGAQVTRMDTYMDSGMDGGPFGPNRCTLMVECSIAPSSLPTDNGDQIIALRVIAQSMGKPFDITFDDGQTRLVNEPVAPPDWETADSLLPALTALARKLRVKEDEPWP